MAKRLTPENIGAALGQLANKIDAWKKQRDALISEGERLSGVALSYVRDLRGHAGQEVRRRGGRPKGMKMSEETKAKLRAAWKRRKARMAQAVSGDAPSKKRGPRRSKQD